MIRIMDGLDQAYINGLFEQLLLVSGLALSMISFTCAFIIIHTIAKR